MVCGSVKFADFVVLLRSESFVDFVVWWIREKAEMDFRFRQVSFRHSFWIEESEFDSIQFNSWKTISQCWANRGRNLAINGAISGWFRFFILPPDKSH